MNWPQSVLFTLSLSSSLYAYNVTEHLISLPLEKSNFGTLQLLYSTANLITGVYRQPVITKSNKENADLSHDLGCYLQFSTADNSVKLNTCIASPNAPTLHWGLDGQVMLNDTEIVIAGNSTDISVATNNDNNQHNSLSFYTLDIVSGIFTNIAHTNYHINTDNSVILKKITNVDGTKLVFIILARNYLDQSTNRLTIFTSSNGKDWQQNAELNIDSSIEYIDNLSYINNQYILTTFKYPRNDHYPKILISNDLINWKISSLSNIDQQYENAENYFYIYPVNNYGLIAEHLTMDLEDGYTPKITDLSYFQSSDNSLSWSKLSLQLPTNLLDATNNYTCSVPRIIDIFAGNNNYFLHVACYDPLELYYNNYTPYIDHEALLVTSSLDLNSSIITLSVWDNFGNKPMQSCQSAKDGDDNKVYCLSTRSDNNFLLRVFDS